jgi:hypothetical protein
MRRATPLWRPRTTVYAAAVMPAPIDELLHRVNNLLGTIQTQVEVARETGTFEACRDALRMIAESASRTQAMVQRFRAGGPLTDRAAP